MGIQKVRLRVNAWFGENDLDLSFPSNWRVQECRMAGHDRPALTDEEIRAALRNPMGTPPLRELARGRREAVILFDDLTKPTPASRLVPFVLEELHAGGMGDDHIRFLCAPGTHRPLIYPELAAKLGADLVQRYPVYNHSIWENLAYFGTTRLGTPVHVNREYASCDLRLAIGGVIPHEWAGFGGGGKIAVPGIAGIETIHAHHQKLRAAPYAATAGLGRVDGNAFRLDLEEAARLADLHFKVDTLLNNRREVVGVFAGDFVATHRAASRLAPEVYRTEVAREADVVISNGYPDEGQFIRYTWCVQLSLRHGGDAVLVTYAHEAQNLHQYAGRFGSDYGGRGWKPGGRARHLAGADRVLVLAPYLPMVDRLELGAAEKVVWCRDWGEVLADLVDRHGPGARVAVYPYAPLQYEASDE